MKKFFKNLLQMKAFKNVEFFELKAYEGGNVHCRRYYGDAVDDAAIRFARKYNASVASVEACNYYGNVVDKYFVNA